MFLLLSWLIILSVATTLAASINIPSVMIEWEDGVFITHSLNPFTARFFQYQRNIFDYCIIIMFFIALSTLIAGSYLASTKEREVAYARLHELPLPRTEQQAHEHVPVQYLDMRAAIGFIFMASAVLVLLFFFISHLIYVILVVFTIGGTQGKISSMHGYKCAFAVVMEL